MSAAEITQLYNSGETLYAGENYGNYTSASSLGEYWTMDDNVETGNGSGTTLYGLTTMEHLMGAHLENPHLLIQ